jgi:molybdopterin-guanine dinucleotide biosynthesis protein A
MTLAILAGGAGSRMGMPKAQLELEGKPILQWLLDQLQWPGPTLLVTAPAVVDPPGSQLFDRTAVDPVDGAGPLRGVLSALEHLDTPLAAIITVDMPRIEKRHLAWLVESLLSSGDSLGVMCRVRVGQEQRIESFPCVLRAQAAECVAARLASGRSSVQGLCDMPRFCALDAPADWPAETWTNLNHRDDLAAFAAGRKR